MISVVVAAAGAGAGASNGRANGTGNENENGNGRANASATGQSHADDNAALADPQLPSNADLNPGGANNDGDCGAYCSTRDGSPSLNGNGNGNATGQPCAGCVGKADNKNPPGQQHDGSDANNGYECDGNRGIARTNPAHTGCQAVVTTTTTGPTTTTTGPTTTTTGPTTTTTGPTTTTAGLTGTTTPTTTAPAVLGAVVSPAPGHEAPAPAPASVAGAVAGAEAELPRTGGAALGVMIAGLGLILMGLGGRRLRSG